MNIYQKLSEITAEMQIVAKNLNVSAGKNNSYKAVSERDIIDNVKPLEAKHGVYSYPVSRETLESERLETDTQYGTKTTFYTRIKTVYRFVNIDDPQDFVETVTFSVGLDSGDKGDGKAMTYGDKYSLMKAYKISTGDDPDQNASIEANYRKQTATEPIHEKANEDRIDSLRRAINSLMSGFSDVDKKSIWAQARADINMQKASSVDMNAEELSQMKIAVAEVLRRTQA